MLSPRGCGGRQRQPLRRRHSTTACSNTTLHSPAAFHFHALVRAANRVFGQGGSFTSNTANNGGVSADSLEFPKGVAVDADGNLYVADNGNNRVLEYNTPLTSDTTADIVFGQGGSFTSNNIGVSADSLHSPTGIALDAGSDLYVADNVNNRVLEYNTPLTTDTTADAVFGQGGIFASVHCQQRRAERRQPIFTRRDSSGRQRQPLHRRQRQQPRARIQQPAYDRHHCRHRIRAGWQLHFGHRQPRWFERRQPIPTHRGCGDPAATSTSPMRTTAECSNTTGH